MKKTIKPGVFRARITRVRTLPGGGLCVDFTPVDKRAAKAYAFFPRPPRRKRTRKGAR